MVDKQGEGDEPDERPDPTGPLLSFDDDTEAMPHWADAPTGEVPVIGSTDETRELDETDDDLGGSRLFPQLPDDPNLVDTSDTGRFDAVRSDTLPSLPTEALHDMARDTGGPDDDESIFAPPDGAVLDPLATGPMDLADLSDPPLAPPAVPDGPPVADTTVIRGLGERDPGAMFDSDAESDALDEEIAAATAFAGGQEPDFDTTRAGSGISDLSGSAALADPGAEDLAPVGAGEESVMGDETDDDPWARLDALPDLDDGPAAPVDPTPAPSEVSALFDDDTPDVAAPLGAGTEPQASTDTDEGDKLDSWADLDSPAPHWREGSQDYEERTTVSDDERTVLHFDDDGAPPGDADDQRGGRNLPMAILVGVALAAAFFGLLRVGPGAAMGMVVIALVLAAAEFYQSVRNVGYRPAALLGLASVGGLALAVYWKGFEAYPLVLGLSVLAGLLWFLFGVEAEHATANLAITIMGVGWIGVLGSFAAMILKMPDGDGILIGAVIGTVAYDVGGYVIGRTTGQSRLAPHISPNKTYEGLIGGMILAIVVTTLALNSIPGVEPWTEMTDALWLGIAIAVMAPLGDLTQSLVKRDLGVKDMGSLLPGHGGVFDRFDALLFVLPAAYYVSDLVLY